LAGQIPLDSTQENEIYFVKVEEMPEPIGGMKTIQEKILYPEIAKRAGIEGRVFVLAFIDETGNVADAKVIKGVGHGLDEAALEAVKQTKFIPGKQKGEPKKVQVSIPIVFKLQ
jgi:periplasmic protein TonB